MVVHVVTIVHMHIHKRNTTTSICGCALSIPTQVFAATGISYQQHNNIWECLEAGALCSVRLDELRVEIVAKIDRHLTRQIPRMEHVWRYLRLCGLDSTIRNKRIQSRACERCIAYTQLCPLEFWIVWKITYEHRGSSIFAVLVALNRLLHRFYSLSPIIFREKQIRSECVVVGFGRKCEAKREMRIIL